LSVSWHHHWVFWLLLEMFAHKDYCILIYTNCWELLMKWVGVNVASDYYSWWRWQSDTLWVTVTRLWLHSFLSRWVWCWDATEVWVFGNICSMGNWWRFSCLMLESWICLNIFEEQEEEADCVYTLEIRRPKDGSQPWYQGHNWSTEHLMDHRLWANVLTNIVFWKLRAAFTDIYCFCCPVLYRVHWGREDDQG
jgi:hypothetical protein